MINSAKEIMKKQYDGFGKVWMLPTMNLQSHQEKVKVKIL
jgi:hypothetical protein